jgi:hypothetical protein
LLDGAKQKPTVPYELFASGSRRITESAISVRRRNAEEALLNIRRHAAAAASGADLIRDRTHNPRLSVVDRPAHSAANLQPATHCIRSFQLKVIGIPNAAANHR